MVQLFAIENGVAQFVIGAMCGFVAQAISRIPIISFGHVVPRALATQNGFNARAVMEDLDEQSKSELQDRAADIMEAWSLPAGSLKLKETHLVILYCALAQAMAEQGISPKFEGESWNIVNNPLKALLANEKKTQEKIEHCRKVFMDYGAVIELLPPE